MMRVRKTLLVGVAGLSLCAAQANTADNPYRAITDRNIFGLKDPPPPAPTEPPKAPPAKITLTGITTILGNKRVLLKTAAAPAKPGEQPKGEQSFIIVEGQKDGDIDVLKIDEVAGSVQIKYAGELMVLNFEKDGPKLPSTPAPGAPGVPGLPMPAAMAGLPSPTGASPSMPAGTAPGMRTIPTRNLRVPAGATPPAMPASSPAYPSQGLTPAATPAALVTPEGATAAQLLAAPSSTGASQANWPPERQHLSREEQALMIEVERERLKAQGNPAFNLLPGTGVDMGQGQAQQQANPQNNVIPMPPLPPGGPRGF